MTIIKSAFAGPSIIGQTVTVLDASSASSLPDLNYGLSDEDFSSWLTGEMCNCPGRDTYSSVYDDSIKAIVQWRRRYRGNPLLWKRVFKRDRVIKELVESAPIIEAVRLVVESSQACERFTIVDLCSGKGYLSMFLSELLPQDKVERLILVDKAWAIASKETKEPLPHHINWDHIYGTNPMTEESYFSTWPIPLHTSKQGKCFNSFVRTSFISLSSASRILRSLRDCSV